MTATTTNETTFTIEPGKQELFISREFEAPVTLLWRAYTDPDLVFQWLGPREFTSEVDVYDVRPGGNWRYVSVDPSGGRYGFHGVFHDVTPHERIIQTFEFEGLPESGHVLLETALFEALPNNRSRVVSHSVFQSVEDRDGMVASGMSEGVLDGYSRLDRAPLQPFVRSPARWGLLRQADSAARASRNARSRAFPASDAARRNSVRASSRRPSLSSRSPRTAGSR